MVAKQLRPGGRSEAVRQRAFEAVIAELSEPSRLLSYDSLARRAEINRATLYRNWPDPAQLIADTLASVLPGIGDAEPADLTEALFALAHEAQAVLRTTAGRTLIANVVAAAQSDPVIGQAVHTYWQGRIGHTVEASGVSVEKVKAAVGLVAGKLLFEALMFQRELPERELRALIERALD
ncbi:hypothetical protein [Psychromicrobium lacuslunae]|uniref:hypothetical protein n=1 Tax=Psychromicrobium lacuslunae TaxID=1618207 RepID=UPI000696AEB5|nr:hypothetical protein [Psychromicrobium lacuslunae]